MEKKQKVKRMSLTLNQTYYDQIDKLIKRGIYYNRGMAVCDALRYLFRLYGLEPFKFQYEDETAPKAPKAE